MSKFSSTITFLRGDFNPISLSKYRQYQILRYKKPLNDNLKKQLSITELGFRYLFHTSNSVLLDYQRFTV